MIGRVFPFGYSAPGAATSLDALMQDESMLLIDTRYSPRSMRPEWRQEALQSKYGKRYRWAGQYLGNLNYKDGSIKIANPTIGIKGLCMYLEEGHSLVLLCACADYHQCHRKVIIEMLKIAVPEIEVIHPDTMVTIPEDSLPCLSIKQPWTWLITSGLKDIENREWATQYRGPLLLHAGSKADTDWFYPARHKKSGQLNVYEAERLEVDDVMPKHVSEYSLRAIVGIANLVDVVTSSGSKWFCGTYGFVLKDARAFDEPIPWRGALRLFPVKVCHLCSLPVREDESEVVGDEHDGPYRLCFNCIK